MLKTSVLETYTVISVCTELSLCCVGSTERLSWMTWSWRLKKQMGQEPKPPKIACKARRLNTLQPMGKSFHMVCCCFQLDILYLG